MIKFLEKANIVFTCWENQIVEVGGSGEEGDEEESLFG
jgi:hypothetical protein